MDNQESNKVVSADGLPAYSEDSSLNVIEVNVIGSSSFTSDDEECETRCGYGKWRPHCLQFFNKTYVLVACIAMYAFMIGFMVNGVNNVNWSSIERRFDLKSVSTGWLVSYYDITAAVFALILGYYGQGKKKARMLAICIIVSAIGSLVMALPHYLTEQYSLGMITENICRNETAVDCVGVGKSYLGNYFYVFLIGQLLHGVGGTALFTIGATLIDDSVLPSKTPFCLGIVYGSVVLGAGSGYIIGGNFLKIYTDFDTVSDVKLTNDDVQWIGAWWIGPIISGVVQLAIVFPISLFGHELPTAKNVRHGRINQAHQTLQSLMSINAEKEKASEYVCKVTCYLLRNPCFVFVTLAMTSEAIFLAGCSAFLPKFVENEFRIEASKAAIYAGMAIIPSAAGGIMLGGYITKKLKLTIKGSLKFIMIACGIGACGTTVLWMKCDPIPIYGVNVAYDGSGLEEGVRLTHTCNERCSCDTDVYDPVCSINNEIEGIYFSPCYAGCTSQDDKNTFTDCRCVSRIANSLNTTLTNENCRQPCEKLMVFITLLFFAMCCAFLPYAPADAVQLRCVEEEFKVFAQGVKMLVIRMLGSFTGPIIMGKVLDSVCTVWREKCNHHLSCWILDHNDLVKGVFIFTCSLKILSFIFSCLALKFYQPPPKGQRSRSGSKRSSQKQSRKHSSATFQKPISESTKLEANQESSKNLVRFCSDGKFGTTIY